MTDKKKSANVIWQIGRVDRSTRRALFNQDGATLWFTGLSGAGKSTLAFLLEHQLTALKYKSYVLDGDNIRHGLNNNLGFTDADREENIRRVGEVSKLFADAGMIALSSFISPFARDRALVREIHTAAKLPFIEIFVDTPLEVCEGRDPKLLYAKARRGEIKDFTGISSPYETPQNPEIVVTTVTTPQDSVAVIMNYLRKQGIIN
jgi:adenylyl-sulfate kinase